MGNSTAIRYGPQAVAALAERFGQPLLAGNIPDPATGRLIAGTVPMRLLTVAGVRMAFVGLTAPMGLYSFFKVKPWQPADVLPGLIAEARRLGARTIVLLSHLGAVDDQALAAAVPGVDLILGGHSHTEMVPPVTVGTTLIAQAGEHGRFLGRLDLDVEHATGRLHLRSAALLPVTEDIPTDPSVLEALAAERLRVREISGRVVAELLEPLEISESEECTAGDLLADALLDRVPGAQAAMVLMGHWRGGLPAGPLTMGALHAAMPSTGNPARALLSGRQILDWLTAALKPENAVRRPHMTRGAVLGIPHVAGMTIRCRADSHEPEEVLIQGKPLRAEERYLVASSDMEFSAAVGYLDVPEESVEYEVPAILPEVVDEYLTARSPVAAPAGGRVRFG